MNELYQFPELLKRRLLQSPRVLRLPRSTTFVLWELVDNPSSRYWSNERLAASLGFSTRSIEMALAQLRAIGFLTMKYRRKRTAIKSLCAEAILRAVEHGVEVAKKACASAKALGLRASFLIRKQVRRISILDIRKGLARVAALPKTDKSDASPSLLRSLGLRPPPKRD